MTSLIICDCGSECDPDQTKTNERSKTEAAQSAKAGDLDTAHSEIGNPGA
jgi:hypothetical protein